MYTTQEDWLIGHTYSNPADPLQTRCQAGRTMRFVDRDPGELLPGQKRQF